MNLAKTKYYVRAKTFNDEEWIPCVDRETAEYCVRNLKHYGYRISEITIIENKKGDYNDTEKQV